MEEDHLGKSQADHEVEHTAGESTPLVLRTEEVVEEAAVELAVRRSCTEAVVSGLALAVGVRTKYTADNAVGTAEEVEEPGVQEGMPCLEVVEAAGPAVVVAVQEAHIELLSGHDWEGVDSA